jgi:hypothetical protein
MFGLNVIEWVGIMKTVSLRLTLSLVFLCLGLRANADCDKQVSCEVTYGDGKSSLLIDNVVSDKNICLAALVINKRYLNGRFYIHAVADLDQDGLYSFQDVQIWDDLKHSKSKFGFADFSPTGAKRVSLMLVQDNNNIYQSVFLKCEVTDIVKSKKSQ